MTDREVMQMALEALEAAIIIVENYTHAGYEGEFDQTITALRERLEQPQQEALERMAENARELGLDYEPPCKTGAQCVGNKCPQCEVPQEEPVAWRNAAIRVGEDLSSVGPDGYYEMTAAQWLDWAMAQEPRGKTSLNAPPASKPVAWIDGSDLALMQRDGRGCIAWATEQNNAKTPLYTASPRQEQPEPVALSERVRSAAYDQIDRFLRNNLGDDDYSEYSVALDALYTHAPRREWEGLTEEERETAHQHNALDSDHAFDFIQAKLKEKNA